MSWSKLSRWFAPLGAALIWVSLLLLFAFLDLRRPHGGVFELLRAGVMKGNGQAFGISLVVREVLPLYGATALIAWAWTHGWTLLFAGRKQAETWSWAWALGITLGALGWVHLFLWWQVPTTLWIFPGIDRVPFWLLFPILALVFTLPLGIWARKHMALEPGRHIGLVVIALSGWVGLGALPLMVREQVHAAPRPTAGHPAKLVLLGIDGCREDMAVQEGLERLQGIRFPNAYTPAPATRLLFHMLWGGDPEVYSIGHAIPSLEEMNGHVPLKLLDDARAKGIKVRFYIDDGGTIGLAGRTDLFDEVLMPARGWENFVNSNLAVRIPLFAVWLDTLRLFPTTTPWASLDLGLRTALNHGRGSDWVTFHSCLAHQPVYLTRNELGEIPGWWRRSPSHFRPYGSWGALPESEVPGWLPERNPSHAYRLRLRSLMKAWEPIWNQLASDPDYKDSVRIFFSDHGERFYHVAPQVQLSGVHGMDLNPWETRVPLIVWGPGMDAFKDETRRKKAVNLLEIRDLAERVVLRGEPFRYDMLGTWPFSASYYHTLNVDFLRPS